MGDSFKNEFMKGVESMTSEDYEKKIQELEAELAGARAAVEAATAGGLAGDGGSEVEVLKASMEATTAHLIKEAFDSKQEMEAVRLEAQKMAEELANYKDKELELAATLAAPGGSKMEGGGEDAILYAAVNDQEQEWKA